MNEYWSIDAIDRQAGVARLVNDEGKTSLIPLTSLPAAVGEGDVLTKTGGVFSPAPEETRRRKERIAALLQNLRKT